MINPRPPSGAAGAWWVTLLSLAVALLLSTAPTAAQERPAPVEGQAPVAAQDRSHRIEEQASATVAASPEIDIESLRERRVFELQGLPAAEFRVLEDGEVREVEEGTDEIRLQPNQMVTRRLPEEASRLGTRGELEVTNQQWALPYQIIGLDAEGEAFELQPLVEVDGGGLRPQSGGGFLGRIFAAVVDARHPGERRTLDPAVEILVTAEVDEVEPRRVSLDRTNSYAQVDLRAASPRDPVLVKLVPTFDPQGGARIEVPVVRGNLRLTISPRSIQGLGLETARVTVRTDDLPSPEGVTVSLHSDRGRLQETRLPLGADGIASTSIRSVTTGEATVSASASSVASVEETVRFDFPWLFLAAAVLGGAVGALIRRARTGSEVRRSLWLDLLVLGVLVGVVVAAAYSIGINLVGFEPSARAGEALVFVLAALGAYFGIPRRSAA